MRRLPRGVDARHSSAHWQAPPSLLLKRSAPDLYRRPRPEIHRVNPENGSTLTVSDRDSQSNCWVNLRILGRPCGFYLHGLGGARADGAGGQAVLTLWELQRALQPTPAQREAAAAGESAIKIVPISTVHTVHIKCPSPLSDPLSPADPRRGGLGRPACVRGRARRAAAGSGARPRPRAGTFGGRGVSDPPWRPRPTPHGIAMQRFLRGLLLL